MIMLARDLGSIPERLHFRFFLRQRSSFHSIRFASMRAQNGGDLAMRTSPRSISASICNAVFIPVWTVPFVVALPAGEHKVVESVVAAVSPPNNVVFGRKQIGARTLSRITLPMAPMTFQAIPLY